MEHPGAGVSPGRRELESGAGEVALAERPAHTAPAVHSVGLPTLLPQSAPWARCVAALIAHTSTGTHGVFVELWS